MEKRKLTASEVKYLSRLAIDLFDKTDREVKGISRLPNGPEQNNTDKMNYVANLFMNFIRTSYPLQEDEIRRPQIKKTVIKTDGVEEFMKTLDQIFKGGEV